MKQMTLILNLEAKREIRLDLGTEATRELVLLMAQAIVAVHLEQQERHPQATQEDDDVND
jgi:hypothetical protein